MGNSENDTHHTSYRILTIKRIENVTQLPNNMTNTEHDDFNGQKSKKDEELNQNIDRITSKELNRQGLLYLKKLTGDYTELERKQFLTNKRTSCGKHSNYFYCINSVLD